MPLQILGALHAIHAVAVFFKLMSPALYSPGADRKGMYTLVILNSLNLAVACRYVCLSLHVICLPHCVATPSCCISHACLTVYIPCADTMGCLLHLICLLHCVHNDSNTLQVFQPMLDTY